MDQSRPDDIACAQEQEAFRQKASSLQLRQNLFNGIGGAMLFGLVSGLVLGGGAMALPWFALAAIPIVSIGLIFMGTRCGIESQLLSQRLGAKLMGSAVKPTVGPAPQPEQEAAKTTPPGMTALTNDADEAEKASGQESEKPSRHVHAIAALERVEQPGQAVSVH